MYSLTMARAHPYRGFFWQSVLISVVVALAHHHSHFAPAGIQTMVCLHGTIPRTVRLLLYQCALPTTLAGLISHHSRCCGCIVAQTWQSLSCIPEAFCTVGATLIDCMWRRQTESG